MPNMNNNDSISNIPMDKAQVDERHIQKESEAFLETAQGIPDEMIRRDAPNMGAPLRELQPEPEVRHRPSAGLNMGPKYLEALNQLDSINNTKAISVQLPMSLKKVEITAITGKEEQTLKSASVSPESFLKKLNEMLYNHTNFIDGSKPTFNDFLDGIYPPDKSALIWGLLSASYVVLPELERECNACGASNIVKSVPNELVHPDTFKRTWDKPVSPAEYSVKQETFGGLITFEFGVPTEKDRLLITGMIHPSSLKDNISKEGSMMSQLDILTFFTRSITVGEPGEETIMTDLTQDIYPFLRNLSPKVADGIRSEIDLTVFDEYMPEFYIESTCTSCGVEQKVEVDIELTYFRKSLAI